MNNINKQLEAILSRLGEMSAFTTTAFLDEWWIGNGDKAKIEDIIDLSGANGVLQNDVVDTDNVVDEAITFGKMNSGNLSPSLDWDEINITPVGSSLSDPYQEASRIFTARGGSYIMGYNSSYNSTTMPQVSSPVNNSWYNMLDGELNGITSINVPIDLLYDLVNKIPRYPTLRFDILLKKDLPNGSITEHKFKIDFSMGNYDRVGGYSHGRTLLVASSNMYYSATYTLQLQSISANPSTVKIGYWWVSGELNLNVSSFLTSTITEYWANFNSVTFPDSSVETDITGGQPSVDNLVSQYGSLRIVPKFSVFQDVAGIRPIYVVRQQYMLVNKELNSNGWAVGERRYGTY